ncbi:MAG: hypothetical protein ACFFC7_32890 [Candidatus Hermodarchaeota archaeon]
MEIRQRARSWFSIWLYECSLTIVVLLSICISFILGNDDFALLAAHGGAILVMVGIPGLLTWRHREYLFFPTRPAEGRTPHPSYISIPTKGDDRYWLYQDHQLEILQAGTPRFIMWGLVFNGFTSLVICIIAALTISWDLDHRDGWYMLPERVSGLIVALTFVIVLFITTVLSIRLFRDYMTPPSQKRLHITVWTPPSTHFPKFVSFQLGTQVIESTLRQSRSSFTGFLLPIGHPIQLQFTSKTASFTLNPEDPLPQILNELVVVIKDWTILNR